MLLVAATLEHIEAELRGSSSLQAILGATVPADWPPGEYDRSAVEYFRSRLLIEDLSSTGWLTWYALTRTSTGARDVLVAGAGFFGPPSDGVVEIGYSVVSSAQRRGYATEIVTALCDFAFSHDDVRSVIAHTVPENVASWRALLRCGFAEAPLSSQPGTLEYVRTRGKDCWPCEQT